MKRYAPLCFLLICMLFAGNAVFAKKVKLIPLDAKLSILTGQVKITRSGRTQTDIITEGVKLFAGDLLETLRESKALLTYSDGTTMKIKPRTLIQVQPLAIKVYKGKTWYKFTKRGTEFQIVTPTLVAGIRGTEFEVAVSSRKKSSVAVVEGKVAVKGKKGGKALLRKGFAVSCDEDMPLSRPLKFNIEKKMASWTGGDWNTASPNDINKMFIKYINIKNEYGEDDPRTKDAYEALKKMQK